MASEKDAAASEAAEFASVLAELEADQAGDDASAEAAPETDSVEGDPEADEESEEIEENELEDEPSDDEALESPDVDTFKSELAELVEGGDLKAVAEKLGLDPKIWKISNREFAAVRKGAAEAKRMKAEADSKATEAAGKLTRAEQLQKGAEEVYGPIVAGATAYRKGDLMQARAAMELMFEDTFENVVANIAKAAKGLDPAQAEVLKLRRELAAEKEAKAQESKKADEARATATEIAGIEGKLKGTPLDGIEGAASEIHEVLRKSYNPALGRYAKTLKEAYGEVKASYAKKAAQLAKVTTKPAPKGKEPPPARQKLAPRSRPQKAATETDEFSASVRAAERAAEREARTVAARRKR